MSKSDCLYTHIANKPYDSPCSRCGATARNAKGQDPCIADLPGVLHACCGHGTRPGYVMFEDGTVLRGDFELKTESINQRSLEVNRKTLAIHGVDL